MADSTTNPPMPVNRTHIDDFVTTETGETIVCHARTWLKSTFLSKTLPTSPTPAEFDPSEQNNWTENGMSLATLDSTKDGRATLYYSKKEQRSLKLQKLRDDSYFKTAYFMEIDMNSMEIPYNIRDNQDQYTENVAAGLLKVLHADEVSRDLIPEMRFVDEFKEYANQNRKNCILKFYKRKVQFEDDDDMVINEFYVTFVVMLKIGKQSRLFVCGQGHTWKYLQHLSVVGFGHKIGVAFMNGMGWRRIAKLDLLLKTPVTFPFSYVVNGAVKSGSSLSSALVNMIPKKTFFNLYRYYNRSFSTETGSESDSAIEKNFDGFKRQFFPIGLKVGIGFVIFDILTVENDYTLDVVENIIEIISDTDS